MVKLGIPRPGLILELAIRSGEPSAGTLLSFPPSATALRLAAWYLPTAFYREEIGFTQPIPSLFFFTPLVYVKKGIVGLSTKPVKGRISPRQDHSTIRVGGLFGFPSESGERLNKPAEREFIPFTA